MVGLPGNLRGFFSETGWCGVVVILCYLSGAGVEIHRQSQINQEKVLPDEYR